MDLVELAQVDLKRRKGSKKLKSNFPFGEYIALMAKNPIGIILHLRNLRNKTQGK
jgi:hypothetical protein